MFAQRSDIICVICIIFADTGFTKFPHTSLIGIRVGQSTAWDHLRGLAQHMLQVLVASSRNVRTWRCVQIYPLLKLDSAPAGGLALLLQRMSVVPTRTVTTIQNAELLRIQPEANSSRAITPAADDLMQQSPREPYPLPSTVLLSTDTRASTEAPAHTSTPSTPQAWGHDFEQHCTDSDWEDDDTPAARKVERPARQIGRPLMRVPRLKQRVTRDTIAPETRR